MRLNNRSFEVTFFVNYKAILLSNFIVLLLLSSVSYAGLFNFDPARKLLASDYSHIVNTADDITAQSPKENHHYVGIGRSPTPIIAYFQSISNELATNFPISNFRYHPSSRAGELTENNEKYLNRYFRDKLGFLSGQEKEIVFIDFSVSGQSLISLKYYYDKFQSKNPDMPKASIHFLFESRRSFILEDFQERLGYLPKYTFIEGTFYSNLYFSKYDKFGINESITIHDIRNDYANPGEAEFILDNRNESMYLKLVKKFKKMNALSQGKAEPLSCKKILKSITEKMPALQW